MTYSERLTVQLAKARRAKSEALGEFSKAVRTKLTVVNQPNDERDVALVADRLSLHAAAAAEVARLAVEVREATELRARAVEFLHTPDYFRHKLEQLDEERLGRRRFASEERRHQRLRRELAVLEHSRSTL